MSKRTFAWVLIALAAGVMLLLLMAREVRAPMHEELFTNESSEIMSLSLTSPAFVEGETVPSEYTCDGKNINPPLAISGVPEGADTLVLVMDDPDIPEAIKEARGIEKFDHWVLYNVAADTVRIEPGAAPGTQGLNSAGNASYTGPCPPPQFEPTEHRYFFRLYAIKGSLEFSEPPTLDEVEVAARAVMIEQVELMGRYDRAD